MIIGFRSSILIWILQLLWITVFSCASARHLGAKPDISLIGCGHTVTDKEIGKRLRLVRSTEDVYCRVKLPGYTTLRFYPNGPAKNASFVLYTGAIDDNRFKHHSAALKTEDTLWRQDLIIHCSKGGLRLTSGKSITFQLELLRERDVIPAYKYGTSHPCPETSDRTLTSEKQLF